MDRWWYCYLILLILPDLAWSNSPQGETLFRQRQPVNRIELTSSPTFGLQLPADFDRATQSTIETCQSADVRRDDILQASNATEVETDDFPQWLNRIDEPQAEVANLSFLESTFPGMDLELQVLPQGLIYKSYLAGEKEPRIQSVWATDQHGNLVWDTTLGGRFSFLRYGTTDPVHPQGWEWAFEGAALPRVDPLGESSPLIAVDYRVGMLSTWRFGGNAFKAGYYHLSSHLGDEFLLNNPGFVRLNYVRDSAIVGWTHDLNRDTQIYGEVAYALNHEDGALPWEFQYGIQHSPHVPGIFGAPFGAINGHTRQDFGYETSVNLQAGWQWWSERSNHTFRVGLQYYSGPSLQYSFVNKYERLMGWGLWFDY